ncbi:MAG: NERD domain-containing protein [Victivallaceae bacterium]|nr:NERD domain-containing protein [Victivallaceae bacterium]
MIAKKPFYKKNIDTLKKAIDSRKLSEKDNLKARNVIAGLRLEQDMAYFLDIEFEKYDDIIVLNDLKVEYNGKTAQIDHLILTCYSAYFIESKSVAGSLSVNEYDEWTHLNGNKVKNIESPLMQSKRHEKILFNLLNDNVDMFSGKILGIQKRLGSYTAHHYIAVSTNGNITGEGRDKHKDSLKKADQITATILDFHKEHAKGLLGTFMDSTNNDDKFKTMSEKELNAMSRFIIKNDISIDNPFKSFGIRNSNSTPHGTNSVKEKQQAYNVRKQTSKCPDCTKQMEILWGQKYKSYYWKCKSCGKNVSINERCQQCNNKFKLKKDGNRYFARCQKCDITELYHKAGK